MKIAYGITCMKSESLDVFKSNLKLLRENFEVVAVLNTNHKVKLDGVKVFNGVGDMRDSRKELHRELSLVDAEIWMPFDSDIEITQKAIKEIKLQCSNLRHKYDFISLYYKNDSPIPAFYTLSSSLTDFYFNGINKLGGTMQPFDDSDFESDSYQTPTNKILGGSLKDVLRGVSYGRRIGEFTNVIDEEDTTTGGASLYFNKNILKREFAWSILDGKSLTWYDSYRTFMLKQDGFRFAKVPIFVNHNRHPKSIQLSWGAVARYIKGLNLYMSYKDGDWNPDKITLHTNELIMYSKGMIKKIKELKSLSKNDTEVINQIKSFLESEKGEWKWK